MCGVQGEQPAATGDQAWLRQYYTQGKAEPAASVPVLTPQPTEKYGEVQRLGAGGEKEVVQVRDRDTLRNVALARPRDGRSPQAFVREARILARLEHPHIVPVHDLGLALDGRPYFTMKLLAGETLEAVLARLRSGDAATIAKYPLPALLDIFVRVCDAAAFAHSRGIIHRDIKPDNVQIGDYGEVRLIDWGLAKVIGDPADRPDRSELSGPATATGTVKGTPGYMAPEQAAGHGNTVDVRTDTYALGALLYALLTWQPPITGDTTTDVLCKTIAGEIVPPRKRAPDRAIPHALDAIACKALSPDPARRYPTADALLADVHAFTAGYATSAETAGPVRLLWLVVKRHRALSFVIAVSLLALASVGFVSVMRIRAALGNLREEQTLRTRLTWAAVPKLLAEARAQIRSLAYDDALETLRTTIGVDPAQAEAWDLAGWIYVGQERYDFAAAAFRHDLRMLLDSRPRPAAAATNNAFIPTQTVATAVGRGAPGAVLDEAPASVRRRARIVTAKTTANDAPRVDPGLALAEDALRLSHGGQRPLAPDEFRKLIEQARAVDSRHARESRTALGVYCSRRNPVAWTNAAHVALVQWAVRALNDSRADLELLPTNNGLVARVTGAAANDLLPLTGLPLVSLNVRGTAVRDLQPLRGMPLRTLDISGTPVATFDPIYGLPLRELAAEGFRKLPADLFARCPTLETVTISAGTELSRQGATWPAAVRVIRK